MTDESSASSSDRTFPVEDEASDIFQQEDSELERIEKIVLSEGEIDNASRDLFQKERITFYPYKEFEQIEKIGDGSCGSVFKAMLKNTERTVVIRSVPLSDEFKLQDLVNEDSQNVLIHRGHVRISDLGISRRMAEFSNLLVKSLGSFQYMDPQVLEILLSIGHKKSSDIYSLGVLLWEISSGRVPFESEEMDNNDLIKEIVKGRRETVEPGTPRGYVKIYRECWHYDDAKRPTIEQVHSALNDIDIDDVVSNYEILMCSLDDLVKEEESSKSKEVEVEIPISDSNAEFGESYKPADSIDNVESTEDADSTSQFSTDIQIDLPPVETFAEIDHYIKGLFRFYVNQFNMQHHSKHVALKVKKYMEVDKKNPTKVFAQVLQHPHFSYFTSLVGFFYRHGIGTLVDYEMAFEMYSMAVNDEDYDILEESESFSTLELFKKENQTIDAEDILQDIIDRMI
ncbi:11066_t:CDS:2 [Acaulospora morrowiae]|uniref:11066_t:CDS:1 n=1 Tax=Acaulospora morrowiae TaxID=94023 RepID=A0A9N9G4F8_9GLOM|nr:11066_t:CDS:2 [Acaulospora morrowiae]